MSEKKLVGLKNIRKVFGEVIALDNINFSIERGVIHGLLGENGAGKSTLMNILYGLYSPDRGEIIVNGKKVKINSPHDSIKLGIGMVHQVSTLVGEFTAVENIILGTKGEHFRLSIDNEVKKITDLSEEFGLRFPLDVKIKELSSGIKQKIEIIRALYRNVELLILDEPTTSLVQSEFQELLKSLQILVERGVTVVFITHKIKEVMEACFSVTVLRKGVVQGSLTREEMSKESLVKLMFIEKDIEVTESALPAVILPEQKKSHEPVLVFKNVSVPGGDKSVGLKNISFELYGGEILGIAAVSGNGEKELAEAVARTELISEGDVLLSGNSIKGLPVLDIFKKGIAYTPEDRIREGILPEGNITENTLLGHQTEERFLKMGLFINWDEAKKAAKKTIIDYNIYTPSENLAIRRLSGGNIQKAIIGRAYLSPVKALITHNPTSGLDISTVEFIFEKLVDTRSKGSGVLWINEDLDELMVLSDRIAVLYQGELKKIFSRDEFDKYAIGLLMIGG